MGDFDLDNAWQRGVRDRILAPHFYRERATDGRYVFIDKGKLATVLQKRFAVDTILQGKDGEAICIEEKIVRWKGRAYDSFFLETKSCTNPGRESDGWMVYGQADYLLYAFEQCDKALLVYLVDFQKLREWFWPAHERYRSYVMPDTSNHTEGRLVPIADVIGARVGCWKFTVKTTDTQGGTP
jgi:hypothetical protein